MSEPNAANIQAVKDYASKLLAVLERIAAALEGKTSPSPQTSVATGLTENAAPRAAAVIDLVTQIPYDTVRKAVLAYQDAKGVHAAQEVLKGFGVKYINELKARPERYQEVLDKLK
jgi:hypothetical protein